jgi:hypothetical protein
MVAGVVVADNEAESQAPPTAATDTGLGVVLVTFTLLAAGVAPVVVAAKLRDVALTVMVGAAPLTTSVTGMLNGLLLTPVEVTMMLLL